MPKTFNFSKADVDNISHIKLENTSVSSSNLILQSVDSNLYFNGSKVGSETTHQILNLNNDTIDTSVNSVFLKAGNIYNLPNANDIGNLKHITINEEGNIDGYSNVSGIQGVTGVDDTIIENFEHSSNKLYVGGIFDSLDNGVKANGIAFYNLTTSTWSNVQDSTGVTGIDNRIRTIRENDSNIYVTGLFSSLTNSIPAKSIARYDTLNNEWSNVQDNTSGVNGVGNEGSNGLLITNSNLYMGGNFTQLSNGATAYGLAIYNIPTSTWSPFEDANGILGVEHVSTSYKAGVDRMIEYQSNIYAIGVFDKLRTAGNPSAIAALNIARYNIPNNEWSNVQDSQGINGTSHVHQIYDMAIYDSNVYICGNFTVLKFGFPGADRQANRIARYDIKANLWSNITDINNNDGLGGVVNSIVAHNSNIYVGGSFTSLGNGSPCNKLARYDIKANLWSNVVGNNGSIDGFNNGQINSLVSIQNDLYMGGSYTQFSDGTGVNYISKFSNSNSISNCVINSNIYKDNQITTSYTLSNIGNLKTLLWTGTGWAIN